ncbi:MAG: diphosphomevalonate decarboxylase [Nitrososphaerota archaeon]
MSKATAKAYTMQALIKYHGLKNWELRIPYHDSISVNTDCLYTTTTVEFGDFETDKLLINGEEVRGRALERVITVIERVRRLAGIDDCCLINSVNHSPIRNAKGLGFSAAAGAALAAAAYEAAGLRKKFGWDLKLISRLARLLAGSACRSVIGEYARWYAGNSDEDSYAVKIATKKDFDIRFIIVPLFMKTSTEEAHREAETSSFFRARIESAQKRCDELVKAIKDNDFKRFGELVELDSLELHAVTMTGHGRLILMNAESLKVINVVKKLRSEGIPAYYSMQTGPTVYVNTLPEWVQEVSKALSEEGLWGIESSVGPGVEVVG